MLRYWCHSSANKLLQVGELSPECYESPLEHWSSVQLSTASPPGAQAQTSRSSTSHEQHRVPMWTTSGCLNAQADPIFQLAVAAEIAPGRSSTESSHPGDAAVAAGTATTSTTSIFSSSHFTFVGMRLASCHSTLCYFRYCLHYSLLLAVSLHFFPPLPFSVRTILPS